MKSGELRVPDYLAHLLEAIDRIADYTATMDEIGFLQSKLVQDAVIRNIEIIGEATRNIERASPEYLSAHPYIPWSAMIAMRNRVAHGYMSIHLPLVWKTIRGDLPALRKAIGKLSAE